MATCNAMIGSGGQLLIPPELQRKGRFDEIFFVGLPTRKEIVEILRIHISKPRANHSGRDPGKYDLDAISQIVYRSKDSGNITYSYTGAEYEAAWLEAMYQAYDQGREPTTEDMVEAMGNTIPLSHTMKDTLEKLISFGKNKCRQASIPEEEEATSSNGDISGLEI